jgi:hypothetical protein
MTDSKGLPQDSLLRVPLWTQDIESSLTMLRDYAEARAESEIGWYRAKVVRQRTWSRWLRGSALVLSMLGGLVPVLSSMQLMKAFGAERFEPQFGQLGYALLALAAGFALFDRFFGFSTAWMRYTTTMLELERRRELFRLTWVGLGLGQDLASPTAVDIPQRAVKLVKDFIVSLKEATERETRAWVIEFQSNIAQLEKDLRSQSEQRHAGAIDVRVADGSKAREGIELLLDQMAVERITGSAGSIGSVTPGLHKVTARAVLDGRSFAASQVVDVYPGAVSQVELTLGVP